MSGARFTRDEMAMLVARDVEDGWAVNLGIGIPLLVPNHIPAGKEIMLHSENGILGVGPSPSAADEDVWLVNAGKQYVTLNPGASLFDHADSFAMIRGGHLDLCVLGAYEVSQNGDLANWTLANSQGPPAVGGAMDLAVGARSIWVMMDHVSKAGESKLVEQCLLPLTAAGVVKRVYTDLAVMDVRDGAFHICETAPGCSVEAVKALTGGRVHGPGQGA